MKSLYKFTSTFNYFNLLRSEQYSEPSCSWITNDNFKEIRYNIKNNPLSLENDLKSKPLTFDIVTSGTIVWKCYRNYSTDYYSKKIKYKLNDGDWTEIRSTADGIVINVNAGDVLQFKANNDQYGSSNTLENGFGDSTAHFNISGNLLSIISEDFFPILDGFPMQYCSVDFLFSNTKVIEAKDLILPQYLSSNCFQGLFKGCTLLQSCPNFENIKTAFYYCFRSMFEGCTSLTKCPVFPKQELPCSASGYGVYEICQSMFKDCTSLTTVYNLPRVKGSDQARLYENMFNGCTSLTSVEHLEIMGDAYYKCSCMFKGCTALTTPPKLPSTNLAMYCYSSMFDGCTSLTIAPELPATSIPAYAYQYMFRQCSSLTNTPAINALLNNYSCYMMFDACYNLQSAGNITITTIQNYSCYGMFYRCDSLTVPPTLTSNGIGSNGCNSMFSCCINLTTAPVLPATNLANKSYANMFAGCTKLNYIKCLAEVKTSNSFDTWLCKADYIGQGQIPSFQPTKLGVASTGVFESKQDTSFWTYGTSGVPSAWTFRTVNS